MAAALRTVLATLVAAPLWAQPEREHALALLGEGVARYRAGDFEGALANFEAAYREFPSPKLLINIGACQRELGRTVQALDAYERFLRAAGPDMPAAAVAEARSATEMLRAQVGLVAVRAPPGSEIAIDGRAAGRAPIEPVRVLPGTHRVTLAAPGRPPVEVVAEVGAGSAVTVAPPRDAALPPPRDPPGPRLRPDALGAQAPRQVREGPRPFYRRWPFWVGVGAVVTASIVTGVVLVRGAGGDSVSATDLGADEALDFR